MKRPLTIVAAVCSVAFLLQFIGYWTIPMAVAAGIFYEVNDRHTGKMNRSMIITVTMLLSLLYFAAANYSYDDHHRILMEQETVRGRGIIEEADYYEYGHVYTLGSWVDDDGNKIGYGLRISSQDYGEIGQEVTFQGSVRHNLRGYNEGSFDSQKYFKEKGVIGEIKGDFRVVRQTNRFWFQKKMISIRSQHFDRIKSMMPKRHADVIGELFFGLKSVEEGDRDMFMKSGTVHILAISGLHVGLVSMLLMGLFRIFTSNTRYIAVLVLLLTALYCIYTGGHVSTVRATWMIGLYLGHYIVYRRYDTYTGLAFAFMIMIIINPLMITGVGFILSFGAVLSIFYIAPKLEKGLLAKENFLVQSIRILLAIQLGLSPILVTVYHELPLYGFLANLLILPVLALIIAITAASVMLTYIDVGFAEFILGSGFWLVNYLLDAVRWVSGLPYSTIPIARPSVVILVIYYIVIVCLVIGRDRLAGVGSIVLILAIVIPIFIPNQSLRIDMMDVGNGDAMFIRYEDQVMLIDGGGQIGYEGPNTGERILLPYLAYHGIREIDTVFLSHSDFDHIYGIIELMSQVPVKRLILPIVYRSYEDDWAQRLVRLCERHDTEVIYVQSGDSVHIHDLSLEILYPLDERHRDSNNRHSMVSMVHLDEFTMLVTGDAYAEDEEEILDYYKDLGPVDVLKVGHHGSKTSTSETLMEEVLPRAALVSVGRANLYGHPAPEVRKRLEIYADQVYMTKDCGQITLTYFNDEITIDTYID